MGNNIGAILRKYRIEKGISIRDVSYLIQKGYKASIKTIYSWENGYTQPTPGAFLSLCQLYEIMDILQAFGYGKHDSYTKYPM